MVFNSIFNKKKTLVSWIVGFSVILLFSSVTGCGKKGPLYIPTEEERAQMLKEQAERDAILKARKEREEKEQQEHEEQNKTVAH